MHIELVSIGDELLKGMVVNTNVAFMSRLLFERGYEVSRHTVFSDDPLILDKELRAALSRSSLIIATGGLGTTIDDHTQAIAATLFDSEIVYNEQIAADIRRRFGELSNVEEQARLPLKAQLLPNHVGLAPGLIFATGNKMLILLPGIPAEMQVMFTEGVLPFLQEKVPVKEKQTCVQLHFCGVIENTIDCFIRQQTEHFPDVQVGIYPSYGKVSVILHSRSHQQVAEYANKLRTHFATQLFSEKSDKIEEAVQQLFIARKKRLALAESCTGGALSAQIVSVAGASDYFLGSFVTYSDALKMRLLNVSEKTLKTKGAVSKETVEEMLLGIFAHSDADIGVAVSGIAGPTRGSEQKPVGTVWAALGERGQTPDVGVFHISGPRSKVIFASTNYLLGALWRKVAHGVRPFQ